MRPPALLVEGLRRSFGQHEVLREVSFAVAAGETLALVGANGSGKTTLVEVLATLLLPTDGRAAIHGLDVVSESGAVRRLIGYCPSALRSWYPRLSGRRNLQFYAAVYGVETRAVRVRVESLIDRVGLGAAAGQRVERYSDGMAARLCLARALLTDAPVLLLDEPTKSLDPAFRVTVRSLLQEPTAAGRPRTVLWVTHDLEEAAAVSDRVVTLDAGRLHEHKAPDRRAVST